MLERAKITMTLTAFCISLTAEGKEDILTPSMEARAAAGNGLHVAEGPASIFHNPANLVSNLSSELYGEISLSYVNYQYRPYEGDNQASLNLVVPPVFLGGSYKLPFPAKVTAGLAPRGTGLENTINDLPLLVEGQLIRVRAVQIDKSFRTNLGLASKLSDHFQFGYAYLRDIDHEVFKLYGDSDEPTLTIENKGQFSRHIVGMTMIPKPQFSLAAVWASALEKPYEGQTTLINNLAQQETTAYHYFPQEFRLGLQVRIGRYQGLVDYSYRLYEQGRNKRRVGVGQFDGRERDMRNTHNFGITGGLQLKKQRIITGISWQPSVVGPGFNNADGNADVSGVQMNADFDYMDRLTVSGGIFQKQKSKHWGTFASYLYGRRAIPQTSPNSGNYELHIFYLGIGYNLSLSKS